MTSKKSNGSKKDPLKTPKVWERARREKMKIYFNELQEVLPVYDPAVPMSRFEILQKSKAYIKDLQEQNQDLLNGGFDEVYKTKMTKMKQRVKELLKRIDQLTDLLRTANIMIPPLESYPDGQKNPNSFKWMSQRPKKWTEKVNLVVSDEKIKHVLALIKDYKKSSGKISVKKKKVIKNVESTQDVVVISEPSVQKTVVKKKKLLKKSNRTLNLKCAKVSSKYNKSDSSCGPQSPSQFKENQPVDFNLLSNNDLAISKKNVSSEENNSGSAEGRNNVENAGNQGTGGASVNNKFEIPHKFVETQPNVIIPSAPNVLQSNTFILTNDGSLVQLPVLNSGTLYGSNSNIFSQTSIVKPSTGLLTPLVINKPSPVIVLQKPPSQIIQTAQIINTTPQVISVSKPNVQILGNSVVYTSSSSILSTKSLPHILSKAPVNKKRITRDSTVTTYVNKIPIPALSKQSYAKKTVPANPVNAKDKNGNNKEKELLEKPEENDRETVEGNPNVKLREENGHRENEKCNAESEGGENTSKSGISSGSQKRDLLEEETENRKKQKVKETSVISSKENMFKPIENPMASTDGIFCNLGLPNSMNPSLSVSPTAAFLSTFPIVAPSRSEAEDEISERKNDESGISKQNIDDQPSALEKSNKENGTSIKEGTKDHNPKEYLPENSLENALQTQSNVTKEKITEAPKDQLQIVPSNASANVTRNTANNSIDINKHNLAQQQLDNCKSWGQFHENCEIRSEGFYLPSENNMQMNNPVESVEPTNVPSVSFSSITTNMSDSSYKSYPPVESNISVQNPLNDQMTIKNNHFEFSQKENYINSVPTYSSERPVRKKSCCNTVNDSYNNNSAKTQSSNYQIDSGPNYQLIPAKEVPNQRNARTVNWMTEPDVRNRGMVYGSQHEKMISAKPPTYTQSDNFYINNQNAKISSDCSGHFMTNDQNKMNYQKNDFYVKDQRYKTLDKRTDPKCYVKPPQNTYSAFDYNYTGNYGEDESSKYCSVQSYSGKNKKNMNQTKKKTEEIHHVSNEQQSNDSAKRTADQILTNVDFNPVSNQECFTWIPGKNVDWLPSKSFGLDTNLVVPSTLPTLVGDLALGTASGNDINQTKTTSTKICQPNLKANPSDISKDYADLGMGSTTLVSKPVEAVDTNKQYFEPFANLSKNIFDVTPTNMQHSQMPKNDFDKMNFVGNSNTNNETIVLKNIFELPVSKSSGSEFSRNKQRAINNSQNSFLSVSQLVEPPAFEGNSMKNENPLESISNKVDSYSQNYPNYNNQKSYKSKTRSSNCKYSDRKYQGYKNGSSSYTAEALIRSNINTNYQPNEFVADVNTNFFNGKTGQKHDQFSANSKMDFELNMKSEFSSGPSQNIYSDFNFSSPVPNFAIGPTVSTDFGNHDSSGNFSTAQNNSFFGDFITPEYPLSENVSNSLLLPPCSIALQNPFVVDKRNVVAEKNKNNLKQYSTSRNRKHYECSKTSFNDFSIPPASTIFTSSSLSCPSMLTTTACQNLLPVPTQSIPISFSNPSFTTSNISFSSLSSSTSNNYHRFPNPQNSTAVSFLPSNPMLTTCTSKPLTSSHNCYSSNSLTSVTNSVISSPFPVANVTFSTSSQSSIPFFSLSNPIIPSSVPTSSSNSLANFNLSTIFPEINQKGNYHYS